MPPATLAGCRRKLLSALLFGDIETRLRASIDVHITLKGGRNAVGPDVQDEMIRWLPKSRPFNSAQEFLAYVRRTRGRSRVRASTIHSAKGKEWQHVIVLNVVDGCIPDARHRTALQVQAEHNLFYVATTRAMKRLFLIQAPFTRAKHRSEETFDTLSPFVAKIKPVILRRVRFRATQ